MPKIIRYITVLILVLCPVMQFINIFGVKFNFSLADFLIPICGLLWLFNLKNFSFKKNLSFICYFLLYIAVVSLSGIYNLNSSVVSAGMSGLFSELIKIIICAAYFFIFYNGFDEDIEFEWLLYGWAVGLWIFMIYGLIHLTSRFLGTFTDANGAGAYLIFSFGMMLLLLIKTKTQWVRILATASICLSSVCIALTQSRGAWVGFIVALVLLAIVYFKRIYKILAILIPVVIIGYLIFLNVDFSQDYKLSQSMTGRAEEAIEGEGMFTIRLNLSLESLMMGADHPIIGVGKGNFNLNSKEYADRLFDKEENSFIYGEMTRSIPHNTFAGMFAETGAVGFIAFASMFVYLLILLFRQPNEQDKILLIFLISFFVQSLILNLENTRIVWVFLALCFKLQDMPQEEVTAEGKAMQFIGRIRLYGVGLAVLAALVFIFSALRLTDYQKVGTEQIVYEIPETGADIELVYDIEASVNSFCSIRIYKDEINDGNLIDEHVYISSDGYGHFTLNKDEDAQNYKVVLKKDVETGSFVLKNLYYVCDGKETSLMDYKFLPESVKGTANNMGLLSIAHLDKMNKSEPTAWETVSVGECFDIVGVKAGTGITLDIRFKKKPEAPERVSFRYYTDNIWQSPNGKNTVEGSLDLSTICSEWELGETYRYDYNIKSVEAEYYAEILIGKESYAVGMVETNTKHITSIFEQATEDDLIFISVMDEGSNALDAKTVGMMKAFGLSGEIVGKYRQSYIAVVSKKAGFVPFEELSKEKIVKEFKKGEMFGEVALPVDVTLTSAGFEVGNTSGILIDGQEYSPKGRGMNIAVYDMKTGKVTEAVRVDTFISVFY